MSGLSYYKGTFLPTDQLSLRVYDRGVVEGVMASEQLRTFGGKLFAWEAHITRLQESMKILSIEKPADFKDWREIAETLLTSSTSLESNPREMGLTIAISPGFYPTFTPDGISEPTYYLTPYQLPVNRWAGYYQNGVELEVSTVRQVPATCWPSQLKCRSRAHYYLAAQEVKKRAPQAIALLLNQDGFVTETPTANLVAVWNGGATPVVITPRREEILWGISLQYLLKLAKELRWQVKEKSLTVEELLTADEIWLTSTPWAVIPVVSVNQQDIGEGNPGEYYLQILKQWENEVGVAFSQQWFQ
ncbi:Hypothetical protein PBC10988_1520 [Planctomycetales bacterium 10988]|nr:Hypothetical protein PBC10988_1520 [Planctomycetales bacterium 10988]